MEECVQGTTMYNLKIAVSFFCYYCLRIYSSRYWLTELASYSQPMMLKKKKTFTPAFFCASRLVPVLSEVISSDTMCTVIG